MKLYHFGILFVVIAIALFTISDIKTSNYVAASENREKIDKNFSKAIGNAADNLVQVDGIDSLKINKDRAVRRFFQSLYASMNVLDDKDMQKKLQNYVPVIAETCEDGYYIYYSDEYKKSNGYTYVGKRWSEKMPFYYEDDDFVYSFTLSDQLTIYDKNGLLDPSKEQTVFTLDYHELADSDEYAHFRAKRPDSFLLNDDRFYLVRKKCIIDCLEKSMSYYCNQHNNIAKQYGITYKFAMPVTNASQWSRSIDNTSFIVLFQGYPLKNGLDTTYNRFVIAGSEIKKDIVYYLEQKDWYYLYHKAGCPELKKDGIVMLDTPYYLVYDCVKQGAYACPYCCPAGLHAPDINMVGQDLP